MKLGFVNNDSMISESLDSPLYRRRSRGIRAVQVTESGEVSNSSRKITNNTSYYNSSLSLIISWAPESSYSSGNGPSVNPGYYLRQAHLGCLCHRGPQFTSGVSPIRNSMLGEQIIVGQLTNKEGITMHIHIS